MKKFSKFLSILLVAVLCVGLLPAAAFAKDYSTKERTAYVYARRSGQDKIEGVVLNKDGWY